MDIFSKKKRSDIMSKIRGKSTLLEVRGWSILKESGVNFRRHPKNIFGNPDAGNKSRKIAVFFDSAFWHGHDWEKRKKDFKSKQEFWIKKIERNIQRDKEVNAELKRNGWRVIRIWESHMSKKNEKALKSRIIKAWLEKK